MSRNLFIPKFRSSFAMVKIKAAVGLTPARGGFDKGNQTFTWQC